MDPIDAALVTATIANGLLAGVFFVFSVAVSPGFRRVDDRTYVRSFRAINAAILNGMFLTVFIVAPLAAVVSITLQLWHGDPTSLPWIAAGAVCSVLSFGITALGNVPLNRELERSPITSDQDCRAARRRFEGRWNRWNFARTLSSSGALILFAVSLSLG
ncbi:DUF1772 domain-containing protein [Nesterenkonia rhizosphaerae]|uniref:anthrone oxygenase family protein n=1 Tax=Nesterenkonia rhizosphaerae TaxID=1348272 RepID=UPI0031E64252